MAKAHNPAYQTLRPGAVSVIENLGAASENADVLYVDTVFPDRVVARGMLDPEYSWETGPFFADAARAKVGPYHNP